MRQLLRIRPLFLVALAAAIVLTLIFRAAERPRPSLPPDILNETACAQLEKSYAQNQISQIPEGYAMSAAAIAHYDSALRSCMVEMDFRTKFANGTWGENYVLFNATHNELLADCFIEGGPNAAAPFCNNDWYTEGQGGVAPIIPLQSFDAQVAQDMAE